MIRGTVTVFAFDFVVGLLVVFCAGCSREPATEAKALAETTYTNELALCTKNATSRQAADACEVEVDRRWGIAPRFDGGAR